MRCNGINLVVERNEYLAIMGASGSGKSTLMNIVGCLDTATGGEFWLNGLPVCEMGDRELARARNREIGFVFPDFQSVATGIRPGQRRGPVDLCWIET